MIHQKMDTPSVLHKRKYSNFLMCESNQEQRWHRLQWILGITWEYFGTVRYEWIRYRCAPPSGFYWLYECKIHLSVTYGVWNDRSMGCQVIIKILESIQGTCRLNLTMGMIQKNKQTKTKNKKQKKNWCTVSVVIIHYNSDYRLVSDL